MKYNKNIVSNILITEFWDEIEEYVLECVWRLDEDDLWALFDKEIHFTQLDDIERIKLYDYDVEKDGETEYISGTMEVSAIINGYVHWNGEDIYMGSAPIDLGISFYFLVEDNTYLDLELEHVY